MVKLLKQGLKMLKPRISELLPGRVFINEERKIRKTILWKKILHGSLRFLHILYTNIRPVLFCLPSCLYSKLPYKIDPFYLQNGGQ